MAAVICGSLAFDCIMDFDGRFADHILPHQLHILNVSFLVPRLRRDFGGCAGNIAYGLKLLGGEPIPVAALGADGDAYLQRLEQLQIDCRWVPKMAGLQTAQAMIMTDTDNNQITAFHPGAMAQSQWMDAPVHENVKIGIIAPDGSAAMLMHAHQLHDAHIPFVFDPGQQVSRFDGATLRALVDMASWIAVNDYECQMLTQRTGWSVEQVSQRVQALVVTRGAQGSQVWQGGVSTSIAGIAPVAVVDPTGCGDAFRSALLYGLERGWDVTRCAQLGNQMGAWKIAHQGGQNYSLGVHADGA